MKLLLPLCLVLTLMFSACDTFKYTNVKIDYTPKSIFSPDSTTILLVNQVDTMTWGLKNQKKRNVMKAAAFTSLKRAQTLLSQLDHVKVINTVDSLDFKVNTDSVKSLVAKYHANYVLVFKIFNANINLADYQNSTMYYTTDVTVNYLLYESNGVYYKKLNGSVNDPNAEMPDAGILGNLIIHPTIKGNKMAFKVSAEHATENALQDYLPYSITHLRPLYYDLYLQPAADEILNSNFDKAEKLLEPILKDPDPKKAAKAAYDLSIVYESEGDIDAASDMAKQSLDKFNNDLAQNLLNDLKGD